MGKIIAVAGKGGTGKTTLSALLLRGLHAKGISPTLAVDADPNSNLGESLGITIEKTVGDIREDYMRDPQSLPAGMDKVNYLRLLLEQILIEKKDFDLLVMGRQEGRGCYCMVNNILQNFTDMLMANYSYVVVDNEAGMEHLSRRTDGVMDHLFLVTDYSLRGLRALARIKKYIDSSNLVANKMSIVVTRAPQKLNDTFMQEMEAIGIEEYFIMPEDHNLLDFDMEKKSLMDLPNDSPSVVAIDHIVETADV